MTPEQESELRDLTNDLAPNTCGVENPRAWPRLVDHVDSLLAQARADEREAVKRVIDGGSFLHDKAPPRLWANELLAAIDRDAAIRARKDA